jgi:hypothetical protein
MDNNKNEKEERTEAERERYNNELSLLSLHCPIRWGLRRVEKRMEDESQPHTKRGGNPADMWIVTQQLFIDAIVTLIERWEKKKGKKPSVSYI